MFVSSKTTIGFITYLLGLERIVAAFLDVFTQYLNLITKTCLFQLKSSVVNSNRR